LLVVLGLGSAWAGDDGEELRIARVGVELSAAAVRGLELCDRTEVRKRRGLTPLEIEPVPAWTPAGRAGIAAFVRPVDSRLPEGAEAELSWVRGSVGLVGERGLALSWPRGTSGKSLLLLDAGACGAVLRTVDFAGEGSPVLVGRWRNPPDAPADLAFVTSQDHFASADKSRWGVPTPRGTDFEGE